MYTQGPSFVSAVYQFATRGVSLVEKISILCQSHDQVTVARYGFTKASQVAFCTREIPLTLLLMRQFDDMSKLKVS
jgi:hypothetical protein